MTGLSIAELALRAQQLLRDDTLAEAFEKVRTDAFAVIERSAENELHIREHAYQQIKAVEAVRENLNEHVVNLKVLDHQTTKSVG